MDRALRHDKTVEGSAVRSRITEHFSREIEVASKRFRAALPLCRDFDWISRMVVF